MLLALHVYTPPSLGATSWIMSPPLVCTILLPGILLLPRYPRFWISFDLTLQWCYTSFVYHYGHRRYNNRRSWDGFTRIALGSLRTLIAFRSRWPSISSSSSWSLWSLGPGWSMFAWGTRPSSFSSNSLWAIRLAEQSIQGQLNFSVEVLASDDYTGVRILVSIFPFFLLATLCFCNRKKTSCYKL